MPHSEVIVLKASESHTHYASKVRECSNFAVREIRKVCKEVGIRPAGSEGETKGQDYVERLMTPIADEVKRETFTLSPKAFMSWALIGGVLVLISALMGILAFTGVFPAGSNILHALSIVFCLLAVAVAVGEAVFYKKITDSFFKKAESSNVICTRKATGETKRRVILSGHIDTAYELRYKHLGGAKFSCVVAVGAAVSLLLTLILSAAGFFIDNSQLQLVPLIIQTVAVIFPVAVIFFVNYKVSSEGAVDDLTGVFISMAVLLYLKNNDISFENTEVVAMSAGAGEEGLRGSKAYAKSHAEELKNSGVETVFIALDTIRDYDCMSVVTKDMASTVKLDNMACALMKKAAENAEVPVKSVKSALGSTDAAAIQQAGVKSVAFTATDRSKYYHTREDAVVMLEMKTIEDTLKIALEAVFLFDEKGFCDKY